MNENKKIIYAVKWTEVFEGETFTDVDVYDTEEKARKAVRDKIFRWTSMDTFQEAVINSNLCAEKPYWKIDNDEGEMRRADILKREIQ